MTINNQLLSTLSSLAKSSPRLRMSYDLRNSENDNSQRMLNALEPGTVMPIHRHRKTSETVVIVRGSIIERFYDEDGNVTEEVLMVPGGENPVVQVEKGRWHSLECARRARGTTCSAQMGTARSGQIGTGYSAQ